MAKLLWISDAGRTTGFGTVTHNLAERLVRDYGYEIHVLAIGWDAAYPVDTPLKLYRSEAGLARNYLGLDRQVELVKRIEPDLVFINEDPAMLWRRLMDNRFDPEQVLLRSQPIVAYLPIDGYGMPPEWLTLTKLVNVVPYTTFGAHMLQMEPDSFVYHGVDAAFRPLPSDERLEVRRRFGIDDAAFVIGRIDTNSGRKDWGSTWKVIDTALGRGLPEDKTVALFHTKLQEPRSGVDLKALISRGGGKWMVTNEEGWPVEDVVRFINCFDVFLTTSRGEGFGLNVAQAMACGVPVIATDHSSMEEVVGPGGWLIEGAAAMTNPYGVDLILADTEAMADALQFVYENADDRRQKAEAGLRWVERFDWDFAAARFWDIIERRLAE